MWTVNAALKLAYVEQVLELAVGCIIHPEHSPK